MLLSQILIFVLFLFPLVFFHELGHYLFAKFLGVRVLNFSIGFGPKLFRFKLWDTEFAYSLIPLGGYVKMYGDDPFAKNEIPEDQRKYSFVYKKKWEKFWIVFGGPLANFILAYVLFVGLFMAGEKVPEIKVGSLESTSRFYQMGFRTGDVLLKINQKDIFNFSDFPSEKEQVKDFEVLRKGQTAHIAVGLEAKQFTEEFFTTVLNPLRKAVVQNSQGEMWEMTLPPYEKDFSLDEIADIAGEKNLIFSKLNERKEIKIKSENSHEFFSALSEQGFYPLDLVVNSIAMNSPADKIHLKRGDIILSVNNTPIYSFDILRKKLQETKEGKVQSFELSYLQNGQIKKAQITPEETQIEGMKLFTIGVSSSREIIPHRYVETTPKSFFASIKSAFDRTMVNGFRILIGFKQLFMGEVSFKQIGGPLAIGKVASDSFHVSLTYFLSLMALLSINLGVINLFPIPVLDGGHIMFLILEFFNRGPLSDRKMQIAQQVGVSLLFLLIFMALFNDVSRLF
ncbi:MAG: RIP metalloprotease RseP [Bacteriovoracaceae bacterium]|nr:RIP metalloprotease RseP [Bacteriovoracaceae bacterium]